MLWVVVELLFNEPDIVSATKAQILLTSDLTSSFFLCNWTCDRKDITPFTLALQHQYQGIIIIIIIINV